MPRPALAVAARSCLKEGRRELSAWERCPNRTDRVTRMCPACRFRFLVLLLAVPLAYGQSLKAPASHPAVPPLEIRVVGLFWKNFCLEVDLQRTNRSKSPIFLPFVSGVFISASVTDTTNTLEQGAGVAWLNVYGASDIIDSEVMRLAPGQARLDAYCIADTFPVVDSKKKMRRQVPLRGSLRIYARYHLEEPAWQISKQQREEMAHTPRSQWTNADRSSGGNVMIEIPIPCQAHANPADCSSPPPIYQGEHRPPVPDFGN